MAPDPSPPRSEDLRRPDVLGLLRGLPTGLVVLDRRGRVLLYNREEARLSGRRVEAVEGRDFFTEVAPCTQVRELAGLYHQAMADDGAELDEDLEFVFPFPHGEVDVRIRMRKVRCDGGAYGLLLIDDNTRLKETEKALAAALERAQEQAFRDPLTSLYNRRHLELVTPAELKLAHRYGMPVSVMLLDIDHFKGINDRYGHIFGDEVLVAVARCMLSTLRASDTCIRLGGEEFCAILPFAGAEEATAAADRVVDGIRALRFAEDPTLRISVSAGLTTSAAEKVAEPITEAHIAREVERLIVTADGALYQAKKEGRGRTVFRATTGAGPLPAGSSPS